VRVSNGSPHVGQCERHTVSMVGVRRSAYAARFASARTVAPCRRRDDRRHAACQLLPPI